LIAGPEKMKEKVVIIDYELGNLFSVKQACEYLGYKVSISNNKQELLDADYAILPGVGAFADAMANLERSDLVNGIREYVEAGKPLMGVCLGLQLLLTGSDEFGHTKGLDLIPGTVEKFSVQHLNGAALKVPQIQWNVISPGRPWQGTPLQCCKAGDYMYFVHSFYAKPHDEAHVLARTSYGNFDYCSAVLHKNIFATQFHPEKSSGYGINIYKEWFQLNK
jgi:imidazole glycerol-phosphate synthase subunit HisH